jgi:hypothetical protein
MMMPFVAVPGSRIVPTIGPSSLPSISSMTGASTFQPPLALRLKAEQGTSTLCPRLGPALNTTRLATARLRRLRDALIGIELTVAASQADKRSVARLRSIARIW